MRLCRPRGPGGRVLFEAGVWKNREGDILLYRPTKPGQFPRLRRDMEKESHWCLLGLTRDGACTIQLSGLRGREFASLREAKTALMWAQLFREYHFPKN